MHWLDPYRLAEIHRETYVAILKSWVPHGKRDEFARLCGITREYLSCLCALDSKREGNVPIHKRYPSPQVARKIAKALSAPLEIKRSLLESMELAHMNSARLYYDSRKSIEPPLILAQLSELNIAHQQATFGNNLTGVRRAYRVVRDASENLLQRIDPEKYPDSFAQLCLYYHDVQCILDRPDKALFYAKMAQFVLESFDMIESGYTRQGRDNLEINAIRGEAIAYHSLKLDRLVPDILTNRACRTPAYRNSQSFWEPFVKRDFINATVEIPRFGFRELNKIARQIEALCEQNSDGLTLLLIHESWLRSLIKHEKIRQAQHILREEIERLPNLPQAGALHRVLLFKSGADLAWKVHDHESWESYVIETVRLMQKAGLKHQLAEIKRSYGSSLLPILEKLGSSHALAD
ncbi:MAG TPA: hypothetical protein VFI68_10520 [Anaerolineales bacterium]|nr:hypothetical protein [Anaerolineales bacterium]